MKAFIKRLLGLHDKEHQHHFLVTSHGQTASMWLAAVLNRIPEIFCSHGYLYPPKPADLEELSADEFALRQACFKRFEKITLPEYFSELKSATDKPIAGNVLAFFLGSLLAKAGDSIKKRNYRVVNIIRHPVTRLTSTLDTWSSPDKDDAPSFVEFDFNSRCAHLRDFLKPYEVDFSKNKNKSFLVSLLAMEDIARDVALAKSYQIPNIRYEDITSKKEDFKKLVDYLTAKKVNLSTELLDNLFSSKKINAHTTSGISQADQQYHSWEKWKQDVFSFTVQRNNLVKIYDGLNYDFSFVKSF